MRYFNVFIASVVLVLGLGGCKLVPPVNQNPDPAPASSPIAVQLLFRYDILDRDGHQVFRPGTLIAAAWDVESKPTSWTSEGVTAIGPRTIATTTPFGFPATYDERTVVVATAFDAIVQPGDEMHCWVEKNGVPLRSTERSFYASTPPVLHGACNYIVGVDV